MPNYKIDLKGTEVNIEVSNYSPPVPAILNRAPEDCSPAEPSEIDWIADTGNELLDDYINEDQDSHEDIEEKLEQEIQKGNEDDRH